MNPSGPGPSSSHQGPRPPYPVAQVRARTPRPRHQAPTVQPNPYGYPTLQPRGPHLQGFSHRLAYPNAQPTYYGYAYKPHPNVQSGAKRPHPPTAYYNKAYYSSETGLTGAADQGKAIATYKEKYTTNPVGALQELCARCWKKAVPVYTQGPTQALKGDGGPFALQQHLFCFQVCSVTDRLMIMAGYRQE